jgi:hypothetical protein
MAAGEWRHAVVVGGTGMLRGVVEHLRDSDVRTTVVARRPDRAVDGVEAVAADWADPATVARALAGRRPDVAVLWVHEPHRRGVLEVVESLLEEGGLLVHVWGSAGPHPPRRTPSSTRTDLVVRHVVLGFVPGPGGSRWLTDEEVSDGVVAALRRPEPVQVVGAVEPWDERP